MLSPPWATAARTVATLLPGWGTAQESRVEPIVTDHSHFTGRVPARSFQLESGDEGFGLRRPAVSLIVATSLYLNGGATYLINSDYQLDARVGRGLNGVSNDYFVGFGAARRF